MRKKCVNPGIIFGPFGVILGHCRATLGHFGSFFAIFGPFCGIFGQTSGKFNFLRSRWGRGTRFQNVCLFLLVFSMQFVLLLMGGTSLSQISFVTTCIGLNPITLPMTINNIKFRNHHRLCFSASLKGTLILAKWASVGKIG